MALTLQDLKTLRELIKEVVHDELDSVVEEKLREKIGLLPTREEFYARMDIVSVELKAIREENAAQQYRLSDHEDRICILEHVAV